MDQTNHGDREPPPPVPEADGVALRRGWPVWVPITMVCGLLAVGGVAVVVAVLVAAATMDGPHDVSDHLHEMGDTMRGAVLEGATLHEALARAQAEGIGLTVAGAAVLINPDPAAWSNPPGMPNPRDARTLLIADCRYEDCFLLPEGEGRAGYYGYTSQWKLRFIPEGELPDWARP